MTKRSVLVVDDDRLVRESLGEALGLLPCHIELAAGGLAGWQSFQAQCHDVVLSDVDMPDISGFELLARIQAYLHSSARPCPVVLMSARADQLTEQASAAGAHCILTKPVALAPLTAVMHSLLHGTTAPEP